MSLQEKVLLYILLWSHIFGSSWMKPRLVNILLPYFTHAAVQVFSSEPGTGPIYLSNLNCQGTETSLLECSSQPVGLHSCSHVQDVNIECEGKSPSAFHL